VFGNSTAYRIRLRLRAAATFVVHPQPVIGSQRDNLGRHHAEFPRAPRLRGKAYSRLRGPRRPVGRYRTQNAARGVLVVVGTGGKSRPRENLRVIQPVAPALQRKDSRTDGPAQARAPGVWWPQRFGPGIDL